MPNQHKPTSRRLADYPDALTVEEVCALLAISEPSARAAIAAGEIPHFRIGRLIRVPKAKLAVLLGQQPAAVAEPTPLLETAHTEQMPAGSSFQPVTRVYRPGPERQIQACLALLQAASPFKRSEK